MKKLAVLIVLALVGCGTSKGYVGENQSADKIAKVDALRYVKMGMHSRYEAYYIIKSNGLEVGSYMGGYPKEIDVLPGKNIITMEYQHNLDKSLLQESLGSGAIGGSIANASRDKVLINVEFNAEAGHQYSIMFYPNLLSAGNSVPQPWVIDRATRKIISGAVPAAVKDPAHIE